MMTPESLYEKLKDIKIGGNTCLYTKEKCEEITPIINKINALKKEKNAIILAHSYVTPDIIYGVADHVGDSYELSKAAKSTSAGTIVFSAVKFMAETAKLLNPDKHVLLPTKNGGCTLADSITGADVAALRASHPDYTFVCYINTTADVKAQCDVCVTSSNVYKIIENLPNDKIYFLPDKLMGKNVEDEMKKRGVKKTIKYTDGTCYVHEAYDPEMIQFLKLEHPGLEVLAHPECNSGVLGQSDYIGSTSQILSHVRESKKDAFFILSECGLVSRLQSENPEKKYIGSCTICKYMKSNSLAQILKTLEDPDDEDVINIEKETQEKALHCINEMFRYA